MNRGIGCRRRLQSGLILLLSASTIPMAHAVPLVADGGAAAVVVIPDGAQPVAAYAAEEFVAHVALATGVALPVAEESAVPESPAARVYIGATQAAAKAGIDVTALPSEAFVLRTVGDALYIAGEDGPGDPLSTGMTFSGTLFGVYEVLERDLGVRWLWPGELGTHVPRAAALSTGAYDQTTAPWLVRRNLRPSLGPRGFAVADPRLAFSEAERARYAEAQTAFLRRHRMGRSAGTYFSERSFGSGHAFEGWWERFGETHPEWFQLGPDGKRGPVRSERPNNVAMCVSNPGFHAKIIELWQEDRAKRPGEPLNIAVSENDVSGGCLCETCLEWDGPPPKIAAAPPGVERSYLPRQSSNRYARFTKRIHELASAIDPDVKVHTYAYLNYFWAPDPGIELHPNIVAGFVPWFRSQGWFPRPEPLQEWIKAQWMGWQRAGASVYYRPNWFLDGYCMPHNYMHQFADAFQFYAKNGMYASDFDSLQGMWAAQGPNLYLLARIHVRPGVDVDLLLDEYYAAFGPAADAVKAYFTYWEDYTMANGDNARRSIQRRASGHFRRYAKYAQLADELYPLEVFDRGFELLDAAESAARGGDPVFTERVVYLREGLEHARRCVETAVVMNNPDTSEADRAAALEALATYRRSIEHTGIANMDRAAIIETDSWRDYPGFASAWGGE